MKFEKTIHLTAYEVEYIDQRTICRETVVLDGGRISALNRLGMRPAGYIAQQFERSGYTVAAIRQGETISAQVDLAQLWGNAQLEIQGARLAAMFKKYQAAEEGDEGNE